MGKPTRANRRGGCGFAWTFAIAFATMVKQRTELARVHARGFRRGSLGIGSIGF
jgi:hypothetical protein